MFNASSLDSGWDYWVLALLAVLLLPGARPVGNTEPPRGKPLIAARLAAEGAR